MRLIIIRHGETYENAAGITQGHLNSKLNQRGIEQAKKVALRLKDEKIDVCYTSDLDRCVDTAKEIILFHPQVQLILTKELREQNKGVCEGRHKDINRQAFIKANVPYHLWDYEGGETFVAVTARNLRFVGELQKKHQGENVLIVTHVGPIRGLLANINNESLEETRKYQARNTELTIIDYNHQKPIVEKLNCGLHLVNL